MHLQPLEVQVVVVEAALVDLTRRVMVRLEEVVLQLAIKLNKRFQGGVWQVYHRYWTEVYMDKRPCRVFYDACV